MTGKTVLITGGSSGIGEALALEYARTGANLFLTGRNKERLDKTCQACLAAGAKSVTGEICEVSDREAMQTLLHKWDTTQPIDLIIANAGISGGGSGRATGEPIAEARRIFDVNLYGVLNTLEPLLERFIARQSGQIALVSSLAGFSAWPGAPSYGASKAAVRLYGEALRGMLRGYNIKVNTILPGFVVSRMTAVNKYKMPFLMNTPKAAQIIVRGLAANRSRIAFPLPTYLFSGLLGLLPDWACRSFTVYFPQKDSCQNDQSI